MVIWSYQYASFSRIGEMVSMIFNQNNWVVVIII